ncbi:MAG TPA: hypothetical protein VFH56_00285 [Acidimicrobiales bacterium]|nr:hypothetical protein [Acidimicrobiales bacterium]
MTNCNRCDATWGGAHMEHCCPCGETFSGATAGDLHRTGDHAVSVGPDRRRCLSVDEMLEKGMTYRVNAHGTRIWSRGGAGYKDKQPREKRFWDAQDGTDGLADQGEGECLEAELAALQSEVSVGGSK